MEDWDLNELWLWDDDEGHDDYVYELAGELADVCFLSFNDLYPNAGEAYNLGYAAPLDWLPLAQQLNGTLDLEEIVDLLASLDDLLRFPGVPTELLEAPVDFLEGVLEGNMPLEPSGRRVGSRRLVKIALVVVRLMRELPDTAQAAVRAWADVQRSRIGSLGGDDCDEEDLADLLFARDLPPAVTGFSMVLGMTLMQWPERAEGLPVPEDVLHPDLYAEVLEQWESLPDSPSVTEEGTGEAEALFAQGQLAHALAELGSVEGLDPDTADEAEMALTYSRLSRAVLWIHNQCRHCPEREGVACKVAIANWSERPVPLLDVAGEIANQGRTEGCIKL
jgi:hypothetical protein